MKYSKLFGKTLHGEQKGSKLVSYQLLTRGGFIAESTAGRYFFLPLGWRVHEKIKQIIKEEMDAVGGQEMLTPTLHPLELWKETNRTSTTGFELMQVRDRHGAEFAIGGTAEEMFVDVVRKFQMSYRDLPINIYQFSNKFRDEARARGGLLRVREFMMKDAYTFNTDATTFKETYDTMAETYSTIFKRLGLTTEKVLADNGYIGGEYCHEYQVEHPEGEGRYFVSADGKYVAHEDVAQFKHTAVNADETVADLKIVEQPEWVRTMEDNTKHYKKDAQYFLKNVVYRNTQGDIIIATIRGDLEVNKTKLEHIVDMVGQLEEATDDDLQAIGTKTGFVHSWGHTFVQPRKTPKGAVARVMYVADNSLTTVVNFIGGQKENTTDSCNVNYGRDFKHEYEGDIAMAQPGFLTPDGTSTLLEKRGIEVGNIFQLGYHYTNLMKDALFTDKDGKTKPFYMGCYGIGLGRTLATIVEKYHDEKGIVWPKQLAPFQVHLISLRGGEQQAAELYQELSDLGIEVLWDDRDLSPGAKFSDADLIGNPIRLVISQKTAGKIEWKERTAQHSELITKEELLARLPR